MRFYSELRELLLGKNSGSGIAMKMKIEFQTIDDFIYFAMYKSEDVIRMKILSDVLYACKFQKEIENEEGILFKISCETFKNLSVSSIKNNLKINGYLGG